jgi:hypothetical protein
MTHAAKLKKAIRARARKTGERYTAARRHVLGEHRRPAPRPAPAPPAAATSTRGLGEAAVRAKTGHGYDHWFAVLDAFGAAARGHTAAARHLREEHGVPGWHSQGITVAYERERGLRAMNQARGGFQVTVTKALAVPVTAVVAALRSGGPWLESADPGLRAALRHGLKPPAKGIATRADGLARLRYKWDATTVEMRIEPRPRGAAISIGNMGLADAAAVEARRGRWRAALAALKRALESGAPGGRS